MLPRQKGDAGDKELPKHDDISYRLLASAIVLGTVCASALFPALATDAPATGAPPRLDLSAPGVAWAGFVAPKEPNYAIAHAFNDYTSPATGLGPVTDDPAHPFANNEVAREMRIKPTLRRDITSNAPARA